MEPFEPAGLYFSFDGAIVDGDLSEWTYEELDPAYFILIFANSDWDGTTDDEDNTCQVWYLMDSSTATWERDFPRAGAWTGWMIDTSTAYVGETDSCAGLDKSIWGSALPISWMPMNGESGGAVAIRYLRYCGDHYPSKWKVWSSQFIGGYLAADITGSWMFMVWITAMRLKWTKMVRFKSIVTENFRHWMPQMNQMWMVLSDLSVLRLLSLSKT